MLAQRSRHQAQTPAKEKPKRAEAAHEGKAAPEQNPVWQSLSWAVQRKASGHPPDDPSTKRTVQRAAYPLATAADARAGHAGSIRYLSGAREGLGSAVTNASETHSGLLQRKCGCGSSASASGGQCAGCSSEDELKLQTKLKIGEPGDVYEQEADRISDQVMRMPEPQLQRASGATNGGSCAVCQTEQPGQPVARLQVQRVGSGDLGQTAAPSGVHEVLRSPGQALDAGTRAFMESRFQHDFSSVRAHTGSAADQLNQTLQAKAFTVGNDIVFGKGQYSPSTTTGKHLLAHELTHTIQQGWAAAHVAPRLQRAPADPHDWGGPGYADDDLNCTGTSKDGPGNLFKTLVGWELRNFDIDKHFLKPEHEDAIDDILPEIEAHIDANPGKTSLVWVLGEASTTAGLTHNLKLSRRRARCVARALEARGVPASAMTVGWIGDVGSEIRLALKRSPTRSDIENPNDRAVTIGLLTIDDPEEPECDTRRASPVLDFRFGCLSSDTFSVVIADQSQSPSIYREFTWEKLLSVPWNCEFFPQLNPTMTHTRTLKTPARLAWTDDKNSPSDFSNITLQRSAAVGPDIEHVLEFDHNNEITPVTFPGIWDPASCEADLRAGNKKATIGKLKPADGVKCGPMPVPKSAKCATPPTTEADCPSTAKKFKAKTDSISLVDKVIDLLGDKFEGSVVQKLKIGTMKTDDEKKKSGSGDTWRPYVFAGKVVHGPEGCEQREPQDSARGEADLGSEESLAGLNARPATLWRTANSNVASLWIAGFGTFKMFSENCASGGTEVLAGAVKQIGKVRCEPLEMAAPPPEKTCKEECPEARRTCADTKFLFKFGRMAPESVPRGLQQQIAKEMGCDVEVARVNIGTVALRPIWRPFLWIQKKYPCSFNVTASTLPGFAGKASVGVKPKFKFRWPPIGLGAKFSTDGLSLATESPDEAEAPSDFSLGTKLMTMALSGSRTSSSIGISGAKLTHYHMLTVGTPVDWTGSCKSSDTGLLIPDGKVDCGWVPSPAHEPARADTCPTDSVTTIQNVLFLWKNFNMLDSLGTRTGLVTQLTTGSKPLYRAGQTVRNARFVGLSFDPSGKPVPVVILFDMEVLNVAVLTSRVEVRFLVLSQPCAYRWGVERIPFRIFTDRCEESIRQGETYTVSSEFKFLPPPPPAGP